MDRHPHRVTCTSLFGRRWFSTHREARDRFCIAACHLVKLRRWTNPPWETHLSASNRIIRHLGSLDIVLVMCIETKFYIHICYCHELNYKPFTSAIICCIYSNHFDKRERELVSLFCWFWPQLSGCWRSVASLVPDRQRLLSYFRSSKSNKTGNNDYFSC